MSKSQFQKFKIKKVYSGEQISQYDRQVSDSILAKLIARAFAADHPELFGPKLADVLREHSDTE